MAANHRYRVARMHETLRWTAQRNLNIESIEERREEYGKNNDDFFQGSSSFSSVIMSSTALAHK